MIFNRIMLIQVLTIFSLFFLLSNGQFNANIKLHKKRSKNNENHNVQTLQIGQKNHYKKIFHNNEYIHKQMQKSKKQHKLNLHTHRISAQVEHEQALQTFNLQPNVYSFTLQMKIGGFNYNMQIDSGSSDIFIKGEQAKGQPKNKYQCGHACINNNKHYVLGYLDGYVQTYEKTLPVELGNLKFNESILVAYKVEDNFQENQGLVGLSYQALSQNPNPTFLQTLKNEKIIDNYAFGVNLNFQDQSRSFITLGSFDNSYFIGNLDYYPLTSQQFYYIDSKGVSFGNGKLLSITTTLFDTGNTCISIPHRYENEILSQFNVNGNVCFFEVQQSADMFSLLRCKFTSFKDVPTLKIHIGDKTYQIQKEYYLQACDRKPGSHQNQDPSTGAWYCDAYIQSVRGMNQLFLGDGFFSRFYTYFDLQTKQVAIAQNRQNITIERIIQNKIDASKSQWKNLIKMLGDDNISNNSTTKTSSTQKPIQSNNNQAPNIFQSFFALFKF